MAEVTPMSRTRPARGERIGLGLRAAEQLDEQSARHVEPLGHHLAHLAVEAVLLAGDRGEAAAGPTGRKDEQREQGEGEQRDLPRKDEHGGERRDDGEDVADDAGQRGRERLLRALHVTVEAGHEGAGLRPAEEPDRHPLDVVEDLCAEIVDETFADARGEPALAEAVDGRQHGETGDEAGEPDDEAGAALLDALVDDRLEDQRGRCAGDGVNDDEEEEQRNGAAVRAGEFGDASQRVAAKAMVDDGAVLGERADLMGQCGGLSTVTEFSEFIS